MPIQTIWFTGYYFDYFLTNIGRNWYNKEDFISFIARPHGEHFIIKRINLLEMYQTEDKVTLPRYDDRTCIEFEKEIADLCENFEISKLNKLWSKAV